MDCSSLTLLTSPFPIDGVWPATMAQLDARLTGDQEVLGLTHAALGTFFHGDFDHEIFSMVILSCWFKKGSCQNVHSTS